MAIWFAGDLRVISTGSRPGSHQAKVPWVIRVGHTHENSGLRSRGILGSPRGLGLNLRVHPKREGRSICPGLVVEIEIDLESGIDLEA